MKRLINKTDHYVIYTDHLKAITAFYQKLGFELSVEDGVPVLIGPQLIIKIHGPASEAKPVPKAISKGGIDICFESDFTSTLRKN
jgi:catechol 2,3-dioxygenase-like lactoylglutathione lyase family enzyme